MSVTLKESLSNLKTFFVGDRSDRGAMAHGVSGSGDGGGAASGREQAAAADDQRAGGR